jgi:hypothetical protein
MYKAHMQHKQHYRLENHQLFEKKPTVMIMSHTTAVAFCMCLLWLSSSCLASHSPEEQEELAEL